MQKAARCVIIHQESQSLGAVVSRVKDLGWSIERQYVSAIDFTESIENGSTSLRDIDVVLIDHSLKRPCTVLELGQHLLDLDPWIILVVIVKGTAAIQDVLMDAWKNGFFWYMDINPSKMDDLLEFYKSDRFKVRMENRKDPPLLEHENKYLRKDLKGSKKVPHIIGKTKVIEQLKEEIIEAAEFGGPTVILGDSGTGKELVARAIHRNDPIRQSGEFIAENCAAITESLFESHFFGHRKGAFTGAIEDRKGLFLLAEGGILFLDEITEIPLHLQSKFLRAMEGYGFNPVGAKKVQRSDTRILAATNKNLQLEVQEGRFRRDLYYRLIGYQINIPSLSERIEDIPLLANHFYSDFCEYRAIRSIPISEDVMKYLKSVDWEGNVRQLRAFVEHLAFRFRKSSAMSVDEVMGIYSRMHGQSELGIVRARRHSESSVKHFAMLDKWETSLRIIKKVFPKLLRSSVPNAMTMFSRCTIVHDDEKSMEVSNTRGEVVSLSIKLISQLLEARETIALPAKLSLASPENRLNMKSLKESFGDGQNNVSKYKRENRAELRRLLLSESARGRWPLLVKYWQP